MLVFTPPALDRHAVPALTVFESTIVPVAKVLPGFVVSAENDANVPEPDAIDTRPITVKSIRYCLTRFLDMVAPSWGSVVIVVSLAPQVARETSSVLRASVYGTGDLSVLRTRRTLT